MRRLAFVAAAALAITVITGCAQQPSATDDTVVSSEAGKVADIVAGPEVRNFDQIRTGDMVVARYVQALSLELMKTTGSPDLTAAALAARAGEIACAQSRASGATA